ncbi:MAG TPA: GNAT family N-acetyltransferase [Acidobacteriota bacterium]
MSDPEVRLFTPSDAAALAELLGRIFSPRVGALASWKYFENPALPAPLVAVAEAAGRELVGCYPLIGRRFLVDQREQLAVLGADLAVLPEHRTGGALHRRLCETVERAALARGVAFAYGFPNLDAYRVSKRWFGLQDWATLECWSRRLRAWPRRSRGASADASAIAVPQWERIESRVESAGLRCRSFLSWRFGAARYRLRLGGDPARGEYLVVRMPQPDDPEAIVVDYGAAAGRASLARLLREEIAGQRVGSARRLTIACLPGSAMAGAAADAGLLRVPQRDRPVTVKPLAGSHPAVPSHLTLADADDP